MAYASNQDVKIYYEVHGAGMPVILAHPFTGSSSYWLDYAYVELLAEHYRVILFDARGHGKSDKPHEVQAYAYPKMAQDVISVLDALKIDRAHYWGYSMGGNIGFTVAKMFSERLCSLVAGGAQPFQEGADDDPSSPMLRVFQQGIAEGADAAVRAMTELAGGMTAQYEATLRALDYYAMIAYWSNQDRENLDGQLSDIEVPCLLYAGDGDEEAHSVTPKIVTQMPDARFISLSGLNHLTVSFASERIVPEVMAFLHEIER